MSGFEINGRSVSPEVWQEFRAKLQENGDIGDIESIFSDNQVTEKEISGITVANSPNSQAHFGSGNFRGINDLLAKHGFNPKSRFPQAGHKVNLSEGSKKPQELPDPNVVQILRGNGLELANIFAKAPAQTEAKKLRYIFYKDPNSGEHRIAVTDRRKGGFQHPDIAGKLKIERKDIICAGYWKIDSDGNGRIDGMSTNYLIEDPDEYEATIQEACKFINGDNGSKSPKFRYALSVDDPPSKETPQTENK